MVARLEAATTTRRVQWEPNEGTKMLGEYWVQTNDPALPGIITIFERDDVGAIMETFATWDDAFDITIVPVVSAEEGLQLVQQMVQQQQGG